MERSSDEARFSQPSLHLIPRSEPLNVLGKRHAFFLQGQKSSALANCDIFGLHLSLFHGLANVLRSFFFLQGKSGLEEVHSWRLPLWLLIDYFILDMFELQKKFMTHGCLREMKPDSGECEFRCLDGVLFLPWPVEINHVND
eukprot:766438-Hanusia_phi.AAC.3